MYTYIYMYIHIYMYVYMGVFKMVVAQKGWFIIGLPVKMDDLGVPLFSETNIYT